MRTARPDDPADGLLYESAAPYYTAYAGGPERARRLLRTLYPRGGHTASWEVCHVAEAGGAIVGVLAAFPSRDGDALARRFVRLTLLHSAPWRIPRLMRHLRATAAVAPHPPSGCSTSTRWRPIRRTAGAAWRARCSTRPSAWRPRPGSTGVALDTGIENRAARSLYERAGFSPSSLRPAPDERIARGGRRLRVRRLRQAPMTSRERVGDALDLRLATSPGRTAARSSCRRRARRPGTRRGGGRSARGRTTSGGSPEGRAWTARRARAARAPSRRGRRRAGAGRRTRTSRARRRPRPRTAASARARRPARRAPSRYQPATRARAASMSSRRSSCARPSAQAMSERR